MTGVERWTSRAERIRDGDSYTYESLARDMVGALGWTAAVDLAAAVRSHVYSGSGGHSLHRDVKPLYEALGWEQAALLAAWFRDARNWPGTRRPRTPGTPNGSATSAGGAASDADH